MSLLAKVLLMTALTLPALSQSTSLNYEVKDRTADGPIEVLDIQFQVEGAAAPTQAWLIRPQAQGAHPAVLYLHMYGPGGNRTQFYREAKTLAAKGVVSLLPQGWVPWRQKWTGDAGDLAKGQAQLAEFQAALGLLTREPGVRKDRLALVGHDYGAMFGLKLLAQNPSIRTAVLLAFAPHYSDWITFFNNKMAMSDDDYDTAMAPLDPLKLLPSLRGRALYLQFAKSDVYIGPERVELIKAAAGEGVPLEIVDAPGTNHEKLSSTGAASRTLWLEKEILAP